MENKTAPVDIHYLMILDKSGSMCSIKGETIENFNSQVTELKKLQDEFPDQNYIVSLVTFNGSVYDTIKFKSSESIEHLNESTYQPDGSTALYDAIGHGVTDIWKAIGNDPSKKAIVIIVTDGEENASSDQKFNSTEKIELVIKNAQADGRWTFVFIGANQDAILAAKSMGIATSNAMSFAADSAGMATMSFSLSNNTRNFAKRVAAGEDVTRGFADSE